MVLLLRRGWVLVLRRQLVLRRLMWRKRLEGRLSWLKPGKC